MIMVFSLISLTLTACGGTQYEQIGETPVPTTQKPDYVILEDEHIKSYNPLSGKEMAEKETADKFVAVMIDGESEINGLSSPDVIFEGLTDGTTPDMMWIYADLSQMTNIGTVGKASHDFVEISSGMGAIIVHNGTTSRGEYAINELEIPTIKVESSTQGSVIKAMLESKGYNKLSTDLSKKPFNVLVGKDREASGSLSGSCTSVAVYYTEEAYQAFEYNKETDKYVNEKGLEVDNVIVMYCDFEAFDGGQDWVLSSGEGLWISNGTGEQINWEKNGANNPLLFSSKKTGEKLVVNEGKTFICIVPTANRTLTEITTK